MEEEDWGRRFDVSRANRVAGRQDEDAESQASKGRQVNMWTIHVFCEMVDQRWIFPGTSLDDARQEVREASKHTKHTNLMPKTLEKVV